ncbi:hypothetical protein P691DRAFT_799046 [Macrolepiota fuliginosa MF-IS2]|uniref:Uncharacterized protein n=1 Tax=Macrolepiota fuliginosa MF-IS2 TaxID=1400762 RepID=A0A9P5X2R2_9AGAR|nr:hypothetical protein P691DRAFT_799046 [Macrolepiota fuliginosa MF-IS2]
MPLVRIEVCDSESYSKSNLVDAISFVLSVRSTQLRSSQLKGLVYRGRKLIQISEDGSSAQDEGEGDKEGGDRTAKTAWMLAVFVDGDGKDISTTGASEYKLNDKIVTYSAYNAALVSHNILVKANNFLVFQGDVETVASQSPHELPRLIEQKSGSLEPSGEYDKAKEAQDRATQNATFNFNKPRGVTGEIKQYKDQKGEAERFEAPVEKRDHLILQPIPFKPFHMEEAITTTSETITKKNKELKGLQDEQRAHDKARIKLKLKERKVEKTLDARPDLVTLKAQITHATCKPNNALKSKNESTTSEQNISEKVKAIEKELTSVLKGRWRRFNEKGDCVRQSGSFDD